MMTVQTALLARYISDPGDGTAPKSRSFWATDAMDAAYDCSSRIPEDVSVGKAAEIFIRWSWGDPQASEEDKAILEELFPSNE